MQNKVVRCLLFDLGGTLWKHGDEAVVRVYEQAADLYALAHLRRLTGTAVFDGMDELAAGARLRKAVERAVRARTRENPLYEPDFEQATCEALSSLGIQGANGKLGAMIFEALRVRSADARQMFEDALATLATLKTRGYALGVVTNRRYGGKPFYTDLQDMGLLDYIEYNCMAISADLGLRKPHPGIFTHALNALHCAPEDAAMVGDSLRADVKGAQMLQIMAVWKPYRLHHSRRDAEEEGIVPDMRIENLRDLLDIFQGHT